MGRSKEAYIEATGGYLNDALHGAEIQALEKRLKSGRLSFDEVEEVRERLIKLKGLPSDEWD